MSNKHTTGPWTIEDPFEEELTIVQAGKSAHEWRTIASIPTGDLVEGWPQETVYANARLIAAAPQLLATLRAIRSDIEGGSGTERNAKSFIKSLHATVDAVISLAEGQ